MLWKKRDKPISLTWKCQAAGCDFVGDDYITLQKHTYGKHPGLTLLCKIEVCDFTCGDCMTLEKHTFWKHPKGLA